MKFNQLTPLYLLAMIFLMSSSLLLLADENKNIHLDTVLKKYDTYVSNIIEQGYAPGVAIAIVTDSQIVFLKGYGVRNIETGDTIEAHTVFRIASVSKGFASVLAAILVNEGIFDWDDKVIKYLPEFTLKDSASTNNLTIRHVLSHTSGVVPHAYDNLIEANIPFEKIVKRLNEVLIGCPVGECYGYQNTIYSLISEIIESATGRDYTYLLKEKIFIPLKMPDASYSQKALIFSGNYARPHVQITGEWFSVRVKDTYYQVIPAAGINASISDMAKWVQALMGGNDQVISPEITREVFEPAIRTGWEKRRFNWKKRLKDAHYGMGWRIFDYSGHKLIFHSGGLRGYLAKLAFLPDDNIGIVVLQNSWTRNPFLYKFLDMYLNLDQEVPPPHTN